MLTDARRMRRLLLGFAHYLLSLGPTSWDRACVYGSPDWEENSLVAAVSLAETGRLKVTLLAEDPRRAERYLALLNPHAARVEIVRKTSILGLLRASTAGVLLFTHGLYGSPDLTGRKVVVNLWHGFGPKATHNSTFTTRIRFDLMPCNTPVWAAAAAATLGSPAARLLQSGNPRQVNLRRPPAPSALHQLGLSSSPYVVWMPTYRSSRGTGGFSWRDAPALSDRPGSDDGPDPVTAVARLAEAANVQVVVKPHPLDADRYEREGLRVITTDEIYAAGMTLYQFIGSSAAMISDYSSAWVEYLDLERPLLLYCPDIAQYREGRGLNVPHMTDIAQDLIVERPEDVAPFLEAVSKGVDWRPGGRKAVRTALRLDAQDAGMTPLVSAVLEELDGRRERRQARLRFRPTRGRSSRYASPGGRRTTDEQRGPGQARPEADLPRRPAPQPCGNRSA